MRPFTDDRILEEPMARAEGHAGIAGDYGPLTPYQLYNSLRQSRGKVPSLRTHTGLSLLVQSEADCLIWSRFRQVHRTNWDYSNFGPFRFSRQQYADQMRILKQQAKISRAQQLAVRAAWPATQEPLNLRPILG